MDANGAFEEGNSCFIDEDYDRALEHYNLAIELGCSNPEVYVKRSALHLKINKYPEAMQDANKAIDLAPGTERAYMHKGMAAFELGEFETAKAAFQKGLDAAKEEKKASSQLSKYETWIRKCDAEIAEEDSSDDEDVPVTKDVTSAKTDAKPTATPAPPSKQETAPKASPAEKSSTEETAPAPAPKEKIPATPIKYSWYQNETHVTISIMKKKLEPSQCKLGIKLDSLCVKVKESEDHEEVTVMNMKLFGKIKTMETVTRFLSSKVELQLVKMKAEQWSTLGVEIESSKPEVLLKDPPKANPYASKKDWNEVNKVMKEELEKDKPEGEEALNKLFQDIYGKATPETRKAMNKSFQTSGGTVLSTNWSEVSEKDYEKDKQAPDGVEWKKWG